MTEQSTTAAVVETPKRRIRVPLPSRSTLTKVGAVTGVFTAGVLVGAKWVKDACTCESGADAADTADQSTD